MIDTASSPAGDTAPIGTVKVKAATIEINLFDPVMRARALESLGSCKIKALGMFGAPKYKYKEKLPRGLNRLSDLNSFLLPTLTALIKMHDLGLKKLEDDIYTFINAKIRYETAWIKRHPQQYGSVVIEGASIFYDDPEHARALIWKSLRTHFLRLDGQQVSAEDLLRTCRQARFAAEREFQGA